MNIDIIGMTFLPTDAFINVGDSVHWFNKDKVPHQIQIDTRQSRVLSVMQPGDTTTANFTDPGIYHYHCVIHPNMKGIISVA